MIKAPVSPSDCKLVPVRLGGQTSLGRTVQRTKTKFSSQICAGGGSLEGNISVLVNTSGSDRLKTMLFQKKVLSEALTQLAILLSLCGLKVDLGLEPHLSCSWYEMIQGPTSVLTQTRFYNLYNHLEDDQSLNPKSIDVDQFFTARRLLGWGRALDRLQVPHTEVETWLVQRELDPFPVRLQRQLSLLEEAHPQGRRESHLEEELGRVAGGHVDSETPSIVPDGSTIDLDLEVHWQDLLAIMEHENVNLDSRPDRNIHSVGSDGDAIHLLDQQNRFTDVPLQHALLGTGNQMDLGPVLLPLTPSSELDNPSDLPAEDLFVGLNPEDNLATFAMDSSSPDFMDMLEPESLSGFGLNRPSYDLPTSSFVPTLEGNLSGSSDVSLLDKEDGLCSPLGELLQDTSMFEAVSLWDPVLEEGFNPEMVAGLEEEGCKAHRGTCPETGGEVSHHPDFEDEMDSDSGLSLDFCHSSASCSYISESSSSSASSSSCGSASGRLFSEDEDEDEDDSFGSEMEVTIKEEDLDEEGLGAVGGSADVKQVLPVGVSGNQEVFYSLSWQEQVDHDHTYTQTWSSTTSPGKMHRRHTKSHGSSPACITGSRDELKARALRIPFSNQLIVSLPVEEFNHLLSRFQLNEEQLCLVKDIRRRGKNKIAAQNCRKRKQNVLLGLEDEVSALRRHRSQLLRGRREALGNLQEMKSRLGMLYHEVFSKLRDEDGKPLNTTEYVLHFGSVDGNKDGKKLGRKE